MSDTPPASPEVILTPQTPVAVVASHWNDEIVSRLLGGCDGRLHELRAAVTHVRVPGAFELPTGAKWLAESGRFEAVICLGCVIRGETPHFDYVAGECARGVMRVSLDTGTPVIFGVLAVETREQALARSGGSHSHAGVAAADAAAEMIRLRRRLAATLRPASGRDAGDDAGGDGGSPEAPAGAAGDRGRRIGGDE